MLAVGKVNSHPSLQTSRFSFMTDLGTKAVALKTRIRKEFEQTVVPVLNRECSKRCLPDLAECCVGSPVEIRWRSAFANQGDFLTRIQFLREKRQGLLLRFSLD